MITKNNGIKCDHCGRFISTEDLQKGEAHNKMVYPESDLTEETYESVCKRCNLKLEAAAGASL